MGFHGKIYHRLGVAPSRNSDHQDDITFLGLGIPINLESWKGCHTQAILGIPYRKRAKLPNKKNAGPGLLDKNGTWDSINHINPSGLATKKTMS